MKKLLKRALTGAMAAAMAVGMSVSAWADNDELFRINEDSTRDFSKLLKWDELNITQNASLDFFTTSYDSFESNILGYRTSDYPTRVVFSEAVVEELKKAKVPQINLSAPGKLTVYVESSYYDVDTTLISDSVLDVDAEITWNDDGSNSFTMYFPKPGPYNVIMYYLSMDGPAAIGLKEFLAFRVEVSNGAPVPAKPADNNTDATPAKLVATMPITATTNVYAKPDVKSGVIGKLINGDTAYIVEKSDGWLKILVSGEKTGYIRTPIDTTGAKWKTVNGAEYLNVRSGPGTNYSVIGTLKKGDKVAVFETKDGWSKISIGSEYGWVSDKYLK